MAEHNAVATTGKNEFNREFVEQKLLQSLNALYDSSRIAKDINVEEARLTSFKDIKSKLTHDDHKPLAALETIDASINSVVAGINDLKSKMGSSEQKVVQGFHEILVKLLDTSVEKSTISSSGYKKALDGFGERMSVKFDRDFGSLNQRIESLRTQKMDATVEETLTNRINDVKSATIRTLKKTIDTVIQVNNNNFSKMQIQVDSQIKKMDYTSIKANVQQEVTESVNSKMKEAISHTQQSIDQLKQQPLSDQMKEYVQKEIANHVGPVNLHKIVTSLPEYQLLKQMVVDKQTKTPQVNLEESPEFQSIKAVMQNMSDELIQLKQKSQSTRSVVEAMKNKGMPTESVMVSFNHSASVDHIEKMEREITAMYNSIKMIENVADTTALDVSPRKRQREENGEYKAKEELITRLEDIEKKQQKLQDFIFQCKDNVLDDDFPTRLDAAMEKIQNILVNHGTFISFLVDPFSTARKLKRPTTGADALDPGMLTAISQLIEQTANEISEPLQKRIKLLEDKLESTQRS